MNNATLSVSNVRIASDSLRVFLQLASMPVPSVRPVANAPITAPGSGNNRVVYQELAASYAAVEPPIWAALLANAARASSPIRAMARFMYCRYAPAWRASSREISS